MQRNTWTNQLCSTVCDVHHEPYILERDCVRKMYTFRIVSIQFKSYSIDGSCCIKTILWIYMSFDQNCATRTIADVMNIARIERTA